MTQPPLKDDLDSHFGAHTLMGWGLFNGLFLPILGAAAWILYEDLYFSKTVFLVVAALCFLSFYVKRIIMMAFIWKQVRGDKRHRRRFYLRAIFELAVPGFLFSNLLEFLKN